MFLENKLKTKKYQQKKYKLNKFNNLFIKNNENITTALSYNFKISDGKLSCGYGFGIVVLPETAASNTTRTVTVGNEDKIDLWQYKCFNNTVNAQADCLIWTTTSGNIGYLHLIGYFTTSVDVEMNFADLPTAIPYTLNDVDNILFSTQTGLYKLSQGEFATYQAVLPKFVDLCTAYNRLWGIVEGRKNKILYSDEMDPTNWSQDENVITINDELGGCNKLIKFEDYLFVFRDYGITKITEYGIKNEFLLYNVFQEKNKIYGKSVVACGDRIIFFATDGLFSFNGSSVSKIDFALEQNCRGVENKNLTATFDGENYILGLKIDFNDNTNVGCESYAGGYTNNAIIFYNIHTNEINVMRGVDVRSVLAVSVGKVEKVFATFFGEYSKDIGMLDCSGTIFSTTLPKYWRSKNLYFDNFEEIKNIKEIDIFASYDCTLKIKSEMEEKTFEIVGNNKKVQKIKTFIKGQRFCFEVLSSNNDVVVLPFKIKYEEVEE